MWLHAVRYVGTVLLPRIRKAASTSIFMEAARYRYFWAVTRLQLLESFRKLSLNSSESRIIFSIRGFGAGGFKMFSRFTRTRSSFSSAIWSMRDFSSSRVGIVRREYQLLRYLLIHSEREHVARTAEVEICFSHPFGIGTKYTRILRGGQTPAKQYTPPASQVLTRYCCARRAPRAPAADRRSPDPMSPQNNSETLRDS